MKGALILSVLAAPALAFVPHASVPKARTAPLQSSPLPGLASAPGAPTVESWLLDNADRKLCKSASRPVCQLGLDWIGLPWGCA